MGSGQQHAGIGAVGAEGQGFLGKLDPALLVGLLKGPVQEGLGLGERRVLVGTALQPGDKLLDHALQRPAFGEVGRAQGTAAPGLLAVWISLRVGHRSASSARSGQLRPLYRVWPAARIEHLLGGAAQ
jgi:hypothetical protein